MPTVFYFMLPEKGYASPRIQLLPATRETIEKLGGHILLGTTLTVSDSEVDAQGFYRPPPEFKT